MMKNQLAGLMKQAQQMQDNEKGAGGDRRDGVEGAAGAVWSRNHDRPPTSGGCASTRR
jgi:hypothetical protein